MKFTCSHNDLSACVFRSLENKEHAKTRSNRRIIFHFFPHVIYDYKTLVMNMRYIKEKILMYVLRFKFATVCQAKINRSHHMRDREKI